MKRPRNWTMRALDREARKLAKNGVTEQEARHVLIVMHGHPTR